MKTSEAELETMRAARKPTSYESSFCQHCNRAFRRQMRTADGRDFPPNADCRLMR